VAISRNPLKLVGRYDFLTFYKVGEQIRIRVRKPLSRKRVLKSPEFKNTRMYAGRMARASKIGSRVYQALPKEFRQFWMYRAFVGEAMTMLNQETLQDEEMFTVLWKTYAAVWHVRAAEEKVEPGNSSGVKIVRQTSSIKPPARWHRRDQFLVSEIFLKDDGCFCIDAEATQRTLRNRKVRKEILSVLCDP
jgi:hypothetical protein